MPDRTAVTAADPMTPNRSRISVIVPVRNGAATLAEALASALHEGCVAEIVVVDDGSTDGSADIARRMGDDRIKVICGPCTGISGAFNAGLEAATAPYIVRCDADDRIMPGSLGPKCSWLDTHPDHVALSSAFGAMTSRGKYLVDLAEFGEPRDVTALLRDGQTVTHFGSWLTRRDALIRIGGARSWFVTAEDVDLQLRLAGQGRVWHDTGIAYLYRLHGGSITHTQTNDERTFYGAMARRFARQRRDGGMDDLEACRPPVFDLDTAKGATAMSVTEHVASLLGGLAWRRLHEGRRGSAIRLMARALCVDPLSRSRWMGLMKILVMSRN